MRAAWDISRNVYSAAGSAAKELTGWLMRPLTGLEARRRAEILIREEEAKAAMRPKSKPKQHHRVGKASSVSTATKAGSGQGVADEPESEEEHEDIDQMLITSTFARRSVVLQQGRAAKGRKDKQKSACSHPPTAQRSPRMTVSASPSTSSTCATSISAPARPSAPAAGRVKSVDLPPVVEPIGISRVERSCY
ncbi:unnamed protein product [Vitrella brassicaformis CCMP3155]|uniref:Uncharacterized protein n=1 Tax=Vitrella brassicaformis (strain CCMP3155) TaxID=1169540 RepID=A0A0G4G6Z6_VITBC|nr:unnamed protein product [Vitrella brassicaformis CCMP3155]|eukprot:CEM24390.1 unnamed protein product [Vitrella brassicaformis CCMP3155]